MEIDNMDKKPSVDGSYCSSEDETKCDLKKESTQNQMHTVSRLMENLSVKEKTSRYSSPYLRIQKVLDDRERVKKMALKRRSKLPKAAKRLCFETKKVDPKENDDEDKIDEA